MLKIKTPKSTWFPLFLHMIWLYRTMDGSIWVPGWLWPEVFSSETLMSEYNSSETFWSEHHSSETFLSLFPFGQRSFLSEYSTKLNHMSANREEGDGNLWPKNLWGRWTSDESVTLTKDASDQKVYDEGFSDERVSDELAFHQRVTPLGRHDRLPHHILNLEFQSDE